MITCGDYFLQVAMNLIKSFHIILEYVNVLNDTKIKMMLYTLHNNCLLLHNGMQLTVILP